MLFDTFEGLFRKRAPKWSINDRFYTVFWTTFLQAPKRCFTKGFLMFCKIVRRHQLLVENVMVFDTFEGPFPKRAPKWSINDRFYKVFRMTFLQAPKRCFTKDFLMFGEVVKRHQLLVENLMLFDTFECLFRKRAPKWSINDRFYKVFWTTFFASSKTLFY